MCVCVCVCVCVCDTNFFDIVAGVLQKDTLASFLLIICQVYVLRTFVNLQ